MEKITNSFLIETIFYSFPFVFCLAKCLINIWNILLIFLY